MSFKITRNCERCGTPVPRRGNFQPAFCDECYLPTIEILYASALVEDHRPATSIRQLVGSRKLTIMLPVGAKPKSGEPG